MNPRKILVAVDFTAASDRALDLGRTLADAFGASLYLLHVVAESMAGSAAAEKARLEGALRLERLLTRADRSMRHAVVCCETGTPAHEIPKYAADNGIDLIVMGTHPHGPTHMMATASVASIVLGSAPCAVLAVKPAQAA